MAADPPAADARLVYFRTAWCGVCEAKQPVAREIAARWSLPFEVVDTETAKGGEFAERTRVRGVPTLALLLGERVPFRLVGRLIDAPTVDGLLARALGTAPPA